MSESDPRPLTLDEATKPVTKKPDSDLEVWQDQETWEAVKEADAGDFATGDEVKATVRKYVPRG